METPEKIDSITEAGSSPVPCSAFLERAVQNVAKWGKQDLETLGLAIAEETGELCQAVLKARWEGGDQERIREEAIDLGALCYQVLLYLDHPPCAVCDRGDFQFGHSDFCPQKNPTRLLRLPRPLPATGEADCPQCRSVKSVARHNSDWTCHKCGFREVVDEDRERDRTPGEIVIAAVIRAAAIEKVIVEGNGTLFVWAANASKQIEAAITEDGWSIVPNDQEQERQ